ncbi:MAG: transposase [Candidatus Moranbacteria bacterium]|nr:transposase [Candidatus Moranbacteria bacterium]
MHRIRKRNRLENYDYSQNGYYFVTICTKDKKYFFGEIKDGEMVLNDYGKIAKKCWLDLPNHYVNCQLDEFIFMPNHMHGIVIIDNDIVESDNFVVGNGLKPFPTKGKKLHGLSEIMRGFKTFSSRRINETNPVNKFQWQKSFYDHVVRNDESLCKIREYIMINPEKWEFDKENLDNL